MIHASFPGQNASICPFLYFTRQPVLQKPFLISYHIIEQLFNI